MVEITYNLNDSKIKYIFDDNNGKEEYYVDNVLMNVVYLNTDINTYIKNIEEGLEVIKLTMNIENVKIERKE